MSAIMISIILSLLFLNLVHCDKHACLTATQRKLPYCNQKLSHQQRVSDLLMRLNVSEKILLTQNTAPATSILPKYEWWSEGLHGVAGSPGVHFRNPTPHATSFPQVCLTGGSFDKVLWHAIGKAVGDEGRAMNNVENAGLTFWAPNINQPRDPRWGRAQETPGEDPLATSEYAINFIRGLQEGKADPTRLKASACCKHDIAYSLENWPPCATCANVTRYEFNAVVNKQDWLDTYTPMFEACVSQHGAASSGIMCSYNAENGIPSCANSALLHDARNKWGFNGYITSDCAAVSTILYSHHYTANESETVRVALLAGTDTDCGDFYPKYMPAALKNGAITIADIDRALTNVFMVLMRLGWFDQQSSQPFMNPKLFGPNRVASKYHIALAQYAAETSIALLSNSGLPWSKQASGTIAVLGPHYNATDVLLGNYYGSPPFIITPLQGIMSEFQQATVIGAKGCDVNSTDTTGFAAACAIAKNASHLVFTMGLDQTIEREGMDRVTIAVPGVQELFVQYILKNCGNHNLSKVTVVLMNGGALDVTAWKNMGVSMLSAGYPGMGGGAAIARILSGSVNPSGRLSFTWYPSSFTTEANMTNMDMRSSGKYPGRTYRFYKNTPVFEFGHGLSYTTFTYEFISAPVTLNYTVIEGALNAANFSVVESRQHPLAHISINVTNTGTVSGSTSVLLYSSVPQISALSTDPVRSLVAFDKTPHLAASASHTIRLPISVPSLAVATTGGTWETRRGVWTLSLSSSANIDHLTVS